MPATNWPMIGRWIGNMPRGQFVHESMAKTRSMNGEAAIGVLLVAPYFIMMPGAAFFHPYVKSRRVSMLLHHREPVQALHSGIT